MTYSVCDLINTFYRVMSFHLPTVCQQDIKHSMQQSRCKAVFTIHLLLTAVLDVNMWNNLNKMLICGLGEKKQQCTITVIWVIPLKGLGFGSWIWCMWSGKRSPFTPLNSWKKSRAAKNTYSLLLPRLSSRRLFAPQKNSLFFIRDCRNQGNDLLSFCQIFRWPCAWASFWLLSLFWKSLLIIRSRSVTHRLGLLFVFVLVCIMAFAGNENIILFISLYQDCSLFPQNIFSVPDWFVFCFCSLITRMCR